MNKKTMIAGLIVVIMLTLGVVFVPKQAKAETSRETVENGIIYEKDSTNYKMSDYWSTDEKKAPVMDGYVFAGWYLKNGERFQAMKDVESANDEAWAKFVPEAVLSVKMQVEKGTNAAKETTSIRVVTTIDSTLYKNVGFDIWFNNRLHITEGTEFNTVFTSIQKENEDGTTTTLYPGQEFDEASKYFAVLKITDIGNVNYKKLIYARPSWTTMDGTKVEGLAKYVHVEDGYASNNWLSIPVDVLGGKAIAAGVVTMKYDETLELIKDSTAIENGRIFEELTYYVDEENHTITFAANAESAESSDVADGIYANVRFQLKTGAEAKENYTFQLTDDSFASWDEKLIDVFLNDYEY